MEFYDLTRIINNNNDNLINKVGDGSTKEKVYYKWNEEDEEYEEEYYEDYMDIFDMYYEYID